MYLPEFLDRENLPRPGKRGLGPAFYRYSTRMDQVQWGDRLGSSRVQGRSPATKLAGRAGSKFADVTGLWRHYPLLLLLLAAVSLLAKNSGKVLLAFYTLLIQLVIP